MQYRIYIKLHNTINFLHIIEGQTPKKNANRISTFYVKKCTILARANDRVAADWRSEKTYTPLKSESGKLFYN